MSSILWFRELMMFSAVVNFNIKGLSHNNTAAPYYTFNQETVSFSRILPRVLWQT
jgi:hypothetical protein